MICYKDRTFCPFYETCRKGATCPDAYTSAVKVDAHQWGGEHAPVSLWMTQPSCFEQKEVK